MIIRVSAQFFLTNHIVYDIIEVYMIEKAELIMAYCKAEWKIVEEYEKLPVFKTPFPLINSALNGGISNQSLIVLTGDTGIGKSTLGLEMIVNLWNTYKYKTYIYSGELDLRATIWTMYKQLKVNLPVLPDIYVRSDGEIEDIEKDLNELKPKFILIDSLMCLTCGIGDTNQLQNNAINKCHEWAIKYDAIVLLVAHSNKNSRDINKKPTINSICGSSNIANQASLILALNKLDNNTRSLEILKNRKTNKLCEIILYYDEKRRIYYHVQGGI